MFWWSGCGLRALVVAELDEHYSLSSLATADGMQCPSADECESLLVFPFDCI